MDSAIWKTVALTSVIGLIASLFFWYFDSFNHTTKAICTLIIAAICIAIFIALLCKENYNFKRKNQELLKSYDALLKNRDAIIKELDKKAEIVNIYNTYIKHFNNQFDIALQIDENMKLQKIYELFLMLDKNLIKEENKK